jgi:hypothetical protein
MEVGLLLGNFARLVVPEMPGPVTKNPNASSKFVPT